MVLVPLTLMSGSCASPISISRLSVEFRFIGLSDVCELAAVPVVLLKPNSLYAESFASAAHLKYMVPAPGVKVSLLVVDERVIVYVVDETAFMAVVSAEVIFELVYTPVAIVPVKFAALAES